MTDTLKRSALLLPVILLATSIGSCATTDTPRPSARIDHIVVGVNDLASGIALFHRLTGVLPVNGGDHPGMGTHNALVSLGDGRYLELLAARPESQAPEAAALRALPGPTPIDWALAYDDFGTVTTTLGAAGFSNSPAEAGSRKTPSGGLLQWSTFGLESPPTGAPFFIHWEPTSPHPSQTSPTGCVLAEMAIGTPDAAALTRFRDAFNVLVKVNSRDPSSLRVTLQCPNGIVSFPPAT